MRLNTKNISKNALVACIYAVMTIAIAPLAYSEIQFRLSEIIVFLAFYHKKWTPGLVLGCLIANFMSPLGWYDWVFGTFSTFLVCITISHTNNRYIAAFLGAVITGLVIGFELHLAFGIPFVLNAIYVFIGELAVLLIGAFIFGKIEKNENIMHFITEI